MSDKSIRVKDRRMFTTDGELREEYREMASQAPAAKPAEPPAARPAERVGERRGEGPSPARAGGGPIAGPGGASRLDPGRPAPPPVETESGATFQDLIALLAQSASVYLQQAAHAPLEHRAESIELARMHIDLLVILKAKTAGNLDPMDQSVLDDVLYRLRLAAVERA